MYTENTEPGCCGWPSREQQFADRAEFILRAQNAKTINALSRLATEIPSLVHNVSALPAALAVQDRAQAISPAANGWEVSDEGKLLPRSLAE